MPSHNYAVRNYRRTVSRSGLEPLHLRDFIIGAAVCFALLALLGALT